MRQRSVEARHEEHGIVSSVCLFRDRSRTRAASARAVRDLAGDLGRGVEAEDLGDGVL